MLTALITANQRELEEANGFEALPDGEDEENGDLSAYADENGQVEVADEELEPVGEDPGAVRRYRFRHPTASGKTIAAAGFVEAARTAGVLILTHRRLLVSQFIRELTAEGYGDRLTPEVLTGQEPPISNPITIQTYAWFARHVGDLNHEAYHLVIADEAHTALGEKTSAAIRSFPDPIYIGMTATEQLIAKQVADVFPASVDDLPLQDAARRGLIAPLRCLRVPPVAAINSVPIVGGDFDEGALAKVLDHEALNQAAASLYRDRFEDTPGIVYAAGVDHAYNLAQEFRAAGLKAEAVSGRTPPVRLAETLAAYERGEINVLINAMLLAEGWNSPRATVVMHLAPTASRRVYQQRIGRIMRMHPRKEAGVVVDFVNKGSTHSDRVITLHSLLDADFYREGARVTPAPRRRYQRRARRRLTPAPWLVPVTPDVRRRLAVIAREWQRIDPKYLDEEEQRYWATFAGRAVRFEERAEHRQELHGRARRQGGPRPVPLHLRGREPQPAAADDGARRPGFHHSRPRELRRSRHARHAGAALGEGPPAGRPHAAAGDRAGEARRTGTDPRPVDVATRAGDAQGAGSRGQRRVRRGQAPARRTRQLTRPPPRRERGEARRSGTRAAAARGCGIAGLGRGLHAACDKAARRRPRGAGHGPRRGRSPRRESPRAEASAALAQAQAPQEARHGSDAYAQRLGGGTCCRSRSRSAGRGDLPGGSLLGAPALRRRSASRLACSSRQAGQPSRCARRPGIAASASLPASSSSTYRSSSSKHAVAADLRPGRSEQTAKCLVGISLLHQVVSSKTWLGGKPALVQMLAQLVPRVVQGLVERPTRRAEPLGKHVDRHAVQGEGDENSALVRGQHLGDRPLNRVQELPLLRLGIGPEIGARHRVPALWIQRQLSPLPGALPKLDGRFEQGKLVGPGREAAGAPKVVETPEHAHEGVVCSLEGDVVELVAAHVRKRQPPAGHFEASRAKEQLMQARVRPRRLVAPQERRSRSQSRDSPSKGNTRAGGATACVRSFIGSMAGRLTVLTRQPSPPAVTLPRVLTRGSAPGTA